MECKIINEDAMPGQVDGQARFGMTAIIFHPRELSNLGVKECFSGRIFNLRSSKRDASDRHKQFERVEFRQRSTAGERAAELHLSRN